MDLTEVAEQMARARAAGQGFVDAFSDCLEEVDQDDERALRATVGAWRAAYRNEPDPRPAAAKRALDSLLDQYEIRHQASAKLLG